ncbi:AmmeMemoRadiSam system protein B [Candidatus Formimonas warabiya]|uniref:AmmeMemoRadiSam system protein B n=1 Tax=Formimonas warabiya TaxID=1761012 RepID=A0A3G1KSC2_FORW1|nr:AmmeMemoRadiSam system protein B [Candidatus Formimonas warabiya]ATW25307.1 AmmeMemoRadiSam system protein B [Candidatus Formimonas warabiya]
MKKIFIVAVLFWAIISFAAITSGRTGTSVKPGSYPPVHPNTFFDPSHFYTGELSQDDHLGKIRGAVVPHHLLADKLIARVFQNLKEQKPATVILIGPNHKNAGEKILTSALGWQTPFGVVDADEELVQKICRSCPLVQQDDEIMGREHAMGNLMPFIKYYLPEAKVVPLILHHDLTINEANSLSKQLAKLMDQNTVLIASVDFSHYLTSDEAKKKDEEILAAMQSHNLGRIFTMGDDYLDSPPSLGVLFNTMEQMGLNSFQVLNHTNSGILLKNKNIATTSYITLVFDIKD